MRELTDGRCIWQHCTQSRLFGCYPVHCQTTPGSRAVQNLASCSHGKPSHSIDKPIGRDSLRLGMSGSATAFAGNAGVIGLLALILVWVSSYAAYL